MTTIAEPIAARLRRARSDAALSLRNLAAAITAAGHPVSHYAVHQYERGASQAPAGYLRAFCVVVAVSPGWLLFGMASAGTETAREEASLAPGRLREGTTDARGFVREAVELGNTLVVLRPSFPEELARLATPIRSAAGECFGALGLALPTGVARPAHLASVLHAADCIERSLPAA